MKTINKKIGILFLAALSGIVFLSSCNKDLPLAATITPESGTSIGQAIAANPNYSIFNAALIRTGIAASLNDTASNFTVFVPDDAAMALSGISLAAVNALPIADLTKLIQYHIIGTKVPSAIFTGSFPNVRMPTTLELDPSNPLLRMSIFPSKLTAFSYVNATPITVIDQVFNNGIIHNVATVVAPPKPVSATIVPSLRNLIAAKPTLSYFRAAIARADSGSVGLSKLDSLLGYAPLNMTVLAPSDSAFKVLIYGLAYRSYLSTRPLPYTATDSLIANATGNGAVAAGPAFLGTNNVTTSLMKGVVAYHFLASLTPAGYQPNVRVFSVNVPSTPTFVKTLVNGSIGIHPGIQASAVFSGAIPSSVTFAGFTINPSTGANVPTGSGNVIDKDNHGFNGVFHIIDRVLLPQ
jgi:uncharacterized surface protein with fasciclin (FAS1) repeats